MKLRFLGTGTSFGIPVIGCGCAVCTSTDPCDRRSRHAAVIETDDGRRRILIDTPPELRLQLIGAGVDDIDAVWFTHGHADHTHGVDDLRAFSAKHRRPIVAYAPRDCAEMLRHRFSYIFDHDRGPLGTTRPEIQLQVLDADETIEIAGFRMTPLPVPHGDTAVFGFRCGDLGYITDAKSISEDVFGRLEGVRTLVLNALWFGNPHPTHFNIEEAIEVARHIGAARTYLTHLTHRVSHAQLLEKLPAGILPAHDGLVLHI